MTLHRPSPGALRVAAALCLAMALPSTPARGETLVDALIAAYGNSNLLEQNRALQRAADEDVPQALAGLRPVLAFVANANHSWTEGALLRQRDEEGQRTGPFTEERNPGSATNARSLGATLDLVLFDSGATRFSAEAAKETVKATREALRQVEQQVLLEAVAAYMEVVRAGEFVALRESNVQLIEQELRAAEDRFDVGAVTRTDVAIAESRLAGARAQLAAAQGDLEVAREGYRASIGHYPGNLVRPVAPPRSPAATEEDAKDVARRSHPVILQGRSQAAAAEALVGRAKSAMKPRLSARATWTHRQNLQRGNTDNSLQYLFRKAESTQDEKSASLTLRAPIYSGGRLSAALRQAIARLDAANAALRQDELNVGETVGRAWSDIVVAQASIVAGERQVEAAQIAFEGVREEASLGARTTLDVLDAEQDLLDARAGLIQAEIQRYVGMYSLMSSMGLMTAEHLNLGIETYDPADYYDAVRRGPLRRVSPQGERLDLVLMRLYRRERRDETPLQ